MSYAPVQTSSGSDPARNSTFRFCQECSNMLYPQEDFQFKRLMFKCRSCDWSEEAPVSCIYSNDPTNSVGETAGITQDVGLDPTVGGSPCPFSPTSAPSTSLSINSSSRLPDTLSSFCTLCGMPVMCEKCSRLFTDEYYPNLESNSL